MKRKDIEYSFDFSDLDIRPSLINKLSDEIFKKGSWGRSYEKICKMSEKDLLEIPYMDQSIVDKMKVHLEEYGLHLEMTEKDLEEYIDAEYNKKHQGQQPEEVKEEEFIKISLQEKDEIKEQPKIRKSVLSIVNCKKDYDNPFDKLFMSDIEWMRYQIRIQLLTHQPWFYCWFFPFSIRLQIAMVQSKELFNVLKEDIKQRATMHKSQKESN